MRLDYSFKFTWIVMYQLIFYTIRDLLAKPKNTPLLNFLTFLEN